ncbi:uncharacterized protein [Nicotiana sylvestris]|uniref:uncharacterized protein n=1 Tax=Nicotiana sylvestris TaxID=4096 RepID=UPI00388CAF23
MDEKGDRIHASIGRSFIQRFKQQIKEMSLYIMRNFVVCPNNMTLKTKNHKFKLMFMHKTTVEDIRDPHFNMHIFKFRTYEQLSNPQEFDNTELFAIKTYNLSNKMIASVCSRTLRYKIMRAITFLQLFGKTLAKR